MLDLKQIKLGSSNPGKLKEYNSFGLSIPSTTIVDLPEVLGSEREVIIYKALSAGENILVEDTSLSIAGFDVGVNIKWLTEDLKTNPKYHQAKATWLVYLGVQQHGKLYLAKGEIKGSIDYTKSVLSNSFGFDSVFVPEGASLSLHELNQNSGKEQYSARKRAIDAFLCQKTEVIPVEEVPEWKGDYQ